MITFHCSKIYCESETTAIDASRGNYFMMEASLTVLFFDHFQLVTIAIAPIPLVGKQRPQATGPLNGLYKRTQTKNSSSKYR